MNIKLSQVDVRFTVPVKFWKVTDSPAEIANWEERGQMQEKILNLKYLRMLVEY